MNIYVYYVMDKCNAHYKFKSLNEALYRTMLYLEIHWCTAKFSSIPVVVEHEVKIEQCKKSYLWPNHWVSDSKIIQSW